MHKTKIPRQLTIDALILHNHKILLIKRKNEPFRGSWALPGGLVDWDETVSNTVKREVKEETGLQVVSFKLLNVFSKPERDPNQRITLAYVVETTGEPQAGDDAADYQWADLDNLPDIAFDHKEIINTYLTQE